MVSNKELEGGLRAIAEGFHLPGDGRMKLSKLVAAHLHWFNAAERRGMTWGDMVRTLAAAGVTGRGGKPLSVGTLSSTVWRKRAEAEEMTDSAARKLGLHVRKVGAPKAASVVPSMKVKQKKPAGPPRTDARIKADQGMAAPIRKGTNDAPANSKKDVLAFMDRARAVRRRSD